MASGKVRYLPKNILDFGYEIRVNANTSKSFTVHSNWDIAFAVIAQGGSSGSRAIIDIVMGYATASRCSVFECFPHSAIVLDTSDASGKSFTITNNDKMDISFTVIPLSRNTISA